MDEETRRRYLLKARDTVYRLFTIRNRSERELRDRLKRKKIPGGIIEETLEYFKEIDLLDDSRFAREWIHSRLKRPFGLRRIRIELKRKGVAKEIIESETAKVSRDLNEDDVVLKLATERRSHYTKLSPEKRRQRLFGYLARRGFSSGAISRAIKYLESRGDNT